MSLKDECEEFYNGRCAFNPIKKCNYCKSVASLDMPAAAAMIMLYYKLLDNISDEKGIKRLGFMILKPIFSGAHKKAAKEYPEVPTHSYLVDAASMFMVKDPKRFEVVVTSNLFGDILTDLGAAIAGGMGLAAGANLNPERKFPSMFEPIHGSAPDIAGQQKSNPLATVWSASQMLEFFGHKQWADRLIEVIEELLVEKRVQTADLGGTATTSQVGDEVIRKLKEK